MAITCRLYREGQLKETGFDPDLVSEFLKEPESLVWVDVESPSPQDIAMLGEEFGFHELALEDCLHPHQRPKIESYGSYFFLVAYGVTLRDGELVGHEVGAFVGKGYLVTVRKAPAIDLRPVVERWDIHQHLLKEGGGYLLYILLDEIVDGYFSTLDSLEDLSEEVEEHVLDSDGDPMAQNQIFRLKKQVLLFRRWVSPLRDVLDVMQRKVVNVVTPELEPYYRDVYDHVLRVTDFVDTLREILSTALDAHLTVVSNRLNEVMKRLTSWAAIILVPTLIAGIYGMNFVHMPELDWLFGYPFALGLMALSAGALYVTFKKRDWL
ncbi:MAG: magnesium/cobalt transporter CorA [Actinobacteria bacterium]|nr:magnesium/cobalt transporter CorA [Actinomycetota bacterium]